MQTITIELNIPDSLMDDDIIGKFATYHGWTQNSDQTALEFSKRHIVNSIKQTAKVIVVNDSLENVRKEKAKEFDDAFNV